MYVFYSIGRIGINYPPNYEKIYRHVMRVAGSLFRRSTL